MRDGFAGEIADDQSRHLGGKRTRLEIFWSLRDSIVDHRFDCSGDNVNCKIEIRHNDLSEFRFEGGTHAGLNALGVGVLPIEIAKMWHFF